MRPETASEGKIRAVVFDLDDTLVFSTVDFRKFRSLVIERIGQHGDDPSLYDPDELIVAIIDRFERRMRDKALPDSDVTARLAELDRIMDAVELERVHETAAVPGAREALEFLKERGIKVGVLTRGCAEYAARALEITGMAGLVDAIEARNSESRPKPNPDSYLRLIQKLGVVKGDSVFVGDHPIDAHCAANAGVTFLAVRTGDVPDDVLREAGSVEVFPDVSHLRAWIEKHI